MTADMQTVLQKQKAAFTSAMPEPMSVRRDRMDRAIALFCKNLRAYLAGEKPPNEVNKKLGY